MTCTHRVFCLIEICLLFLNYSHITRLQCELVINKVKGLDILRFLVKGKCTGLKTADII